jgi:pimeloyl-ACP methyl ester carboxylesterase
VVAAAIGGAGALFALVGGLGACTTPSSSVDGGDLLGVFEQRDAAADAKADARGGGRSRRDAGSMRADASAAQVGSGAPGPGDKARSPTTGTCVAEEGLPSRDLRRVMGRPACRESQVLEWRDAEGSPRYACVIAPKNVETRAPLPVVVFFHPGYGDPTFVDKETGLRKLAARFQLSGDPAHAGFILLSVQGRAIRGKAGAVFDTEYAGADNVDVAVVDHFLDGLTERKLVDRRRVYALGASWGGHMAATYAMMRADRVAAFGVYAADAPPAAWTCPGPPPPAMVVYRACDELFPCASVERWLRARDALSAETAWLRLGVTTGEEANCTLKNKCTELKGVANHRRWPKAREEDILKFFARHTLSVQP